MHALLLTKTLWKHVHVFIEIWNVVQHKWCLICCLLALSLQKKNKKIADISVDTKILRPIKLRQPIK